MTEKNEPKPLKRSTRGFPKTDKTSVGNEKNTSDKSSQILSIAGSSKAKTSENIDHDTDNSNEITTNTCVKQKTLDKFLSKKKKKKETIIRDKPDSESEWSDADDDGDVLNKHEYLSK